MLPASPLDHVITQNRSRAMFAAHSAKAIETIENVPLYRIACECEPGLYWDTIAGWVEHDASVFSQHEKDTLNLPIGGVWEEY